jgi:diguanylate cyclase (GGDEF)-like protein
VDTLIAAALPTMGWAVHGGLLARRLATARRDPLTGLHTRSGFTARAERLIARHPAALVLLVDLDDFKAVNDTHGHGAGDAVLTATAHRLTAWCGRHGIAARLGGDEFAAAVTDPAHTTGPAALRTLLAEPVPHGGRLIPVSASVGCCHRTDLPVPTLTDALTTADAAMYAVKGRGRRNTRHQRPPERPQPPSFRRSGRLLPIQIQRTRKGSPMMPQPAPNTPVCHDCDGFPAVVITTGLRLPDGTRQTLTVACPACKGTGRARTTSALVRTGR